MDQYIFTIQYTILTQLKFWHWQTDGYDVHVALGELYERLSTSIDEVVEAWQGRTQTRITINGLECLAPVDWTDADTAIELLSGVVDTTSEQIMELKKLDAFGDIVNLLEELNGILGKTMYMLTFR